MSALGQQRTFRVVRAMSALPPKAEIAQCRLDVHFVPEAEVAVILRSIRQSKNVSEAALKKLH